MRATRIEIRTRALRAGKTVNGVWEPAGQLIATLWLQEPGEDLARHVAESVTVLDGEEVVATAGGREDVPNE